MVGVGSTQSKMKRTIEKLFGNRLLVEIEPPPTTAGDAKNVIHIPMQVQDKRNTFDAQILLVGDGPLVPKELKVGRWVKLARIGGVKDGVSRTIVSTEDVLMLYDIEPVVGHYVEETKVTAVPIEQAESPATGPA